MTFTLEKSSSHDGDFFFSFTIRSELDQGILSDPLQKLHGSSATVPDWYTRDVLDL